jgi:amino acid transporter
MEKEPYNVDERPGYNGTGEHQAKTGRLAEAADLYGNVEEAEQLGYVTRGYVLVTPGE